MLSPSLIIPDSILFVSIGAVYFHAKIFQPDLVMRILRAQYSFLVAVPCAVECTLAIPTEISLVYSLSLLIPNFAHVLEFRGCQVVRAGGIKAFADQMNNSRDSVLQSPFRCSIFCHVISLGDAEGLVDC